MQKYNFQSITLKYVLLFYLLISFIHNGEYISRFSSFNLFSHIIGLSVNISIGSNFIERLYFERFAPIIHEKD